jgi:hypothetical protein
VYAQFSPTLDDFYAEDLRVVFPPPPARITTPADSPDELRPEIVLTRTVPGQPPKSVRGAGAPFPLAQAAELATAALSESGAEQALSAAASLARREAYLWPAHLPRTQVVQLRLLPGDADVARLLAGEAIHTR